MSKEILFDNPEFLEDDNKQVLELLSSVNDEWISCDDKMPEKSTIIRVWVTISTPNGSYTKKARWELDKFVHNNGKDIKDTVVAWKLYKSPEPYSKT